MKRVRYPKVGEIWYWCEPYGGRFGLEDKICLVMDSKEDVHPNNFYLGRYIDGNDQYYGCVIAQPCLKSEHRAGRLHYIGKL